MKWIQQIKLKKKTHILFLEELIANDIVFLTSMSESDPPIQETSGFDSTDLATKWNQP